MLHFYIDGAPISSATISPLNPDVSETKTFIWTAKGGSHDIKAIADKATELTESDESNNKKTATFSVSPPAVPTPEPAPAPSPQPQEVSVQLSGQSTETTAGQDIVLALSAVNPTANPNLTVQLDLEVPSGMSVTSAEFSQGDEGLYTASYTVKPGDNRQIEIVIRATQAGSFDITDNLTYYFEEDKSTAEHQELSLPVTVTGRDAPAVTPVPAPSPALLPEGGIWPSLWFVLAAVVLGGLIIMAIRGSR